MKIVNVKADFPDEIAAILEGPSSLIMAIPMVSGYEILKLGQALNATADFLELTRKTVSILRQVSEGRSPDLGQIQDTLLQLQEPSVATAEVFDLVRVIIGRAAFAPKSPEQKGSIQ